MKKYQRGIPFAFAKTIYDIDYDILLKQGITTLFFDLDNTIIPYKIKVMNEKEKDFLKALQKKFKILIISNNGKKRVKKALDDLEIRYVASATKPLKRGYQKALKVMGVSSHEVVSIGDQVMTDVIGSNKMGIRPILVLPILRRETKFVTRIGRLIEQKYIKKIKKYEPEVYEERLKMYDQ